VEWPVDLLLDLGIAPDVLLVSLENLLFNETSYSNSKRRTVATLVVIVAGRWLRTSAASGALVGGIEGAEAVLEALRAVEESELLRGTEAEGGLREALESIQRVF
jgi:hypothetical protein